MTVNLTKNRTDDETNLASLEPQPTSLACIPLLSTPQHNTIQICIFVLCFSERPLLLLHFNRLCRRTKAGS